MVKHADLDAYLRDREPRSRTKHATLNRLALFLVADAAERRRPDWEDVPNLTEAEWVVVNAEITTWIERLHAVAGTAGYDAYREATK